MLISIDDYARMYGRSTATVRQRCLAGCFQSARKIGRTWYVDENEYYYDSRTPNIIIPRKNIGEYERLTENDILLSEYAKIHGRDGKTYLQKAIRGGFKTAKKVHNQWFISVSEVPVRKNKKSTE